MAKLATFFQIFMLHAVSCMTRQYRSNAGAAAEPGIVVVVAETSYRSPVAVGAARTAAVEILMMRPSWTKMRPCRPTATAEADAGSAVKGGAASFVGFLMRSGRAVVVAVAGAVASIRNDDLSLQSLVWPLVELESRLLC